MSEPVTLLPGERLESVQELDLVDPPAMHDPLAELCILAGVERPEEIGDNGPVIASRATAANADEPALRLFEIVFGRDSLTVALFVADLFPKLLEATVLHLARFQGKVFDARREEEPGRIAHEIRPPETEGVWGFPYYGTVDATPLFIRGLVRAIERRPAFRAEVQEALDAAVAWLLRRLGEDELGLLSHLRANPHGLENQVWKDSWDSMSHADGTVANHAAPVASLEAQALAYDALVEVASYRRPNGWRAPSKSISGSATSMRSASTATRSPVRRARSRRARRTWAGCSGRGCSTGRRTGNGGSSSSSSRTTSSRRAASGRCRAARRASGRAATTTAPSGRSTTTSSRSVSSGAASPTRRRRCGAGSRPRARRRTACRSSSPAAGRAPT